MQDSTYKLTPRDRDLWHRYISRLVNDQETVAPKHTYGDITSRKLDLHGFTVNEAWLRFREFVEQHRTQGTDSIVVITGKSGQISREFREWCKMMPTVRRYEALGHGHGPAGSFRVTLRTIKQRPR